MGMILDENIKAENLSERIVILIKKAMMEGELKPGDNLPSEQELAVSLGVGKSSVREAIKMLQVLGIVEIKQGRKTKIRKKIGGDMLTPLLFEFILQQSPNKELYEFRIMFEVSASELAMQKATTEDKQNLKKEYEGFVEKHKLGVATVEDDIKFHEMIVEITRNEFVIKIGKTVFELFKGPLLNSQKYSSEIACEDHRKIVEVFCEDVPNYSKLREAIYDSLNTYIKVLDIE